MATPRTLLRVEVLTCLGPRRVQGVMVEVPEGSTVADALKKAAICPLGKVGIWGRVCALSRTLQGGDRVEVYRPLLADPKDARRQRFAAQKRQRPHARSGRPL